MLYCLLSVVFFAFSLMTTGYLIYLCSSVIGSVPLTVMMGILFTQATLYFSSEMCVLSCIKSAFTFSVGCDDGCERDERGQSRANPLNMQR